VVASTGLQRRFTRLLAVRSTVAVPKTSATPMPLIGPTVEWSTS
jgi:hypothetical protein